MVTALLSYLMMGEIKMTGQTGSSTKAYQAADSGMEWALLARKEGKRIADLGLTLDTMCGGNNPNWFHIDDCSYCLELGEEGGQINYFKSVGKCGKVRRAIEVTYD